MPKSHSLHRSRDEAIIAGFDAMPDSEFTKLGLTREQLANAQSGMVGKIVLPTDDSYEKDRMLSNPVFDSMPSMIVYCEAESDVRTALSLSRQSPMPFTIRSGGHCTAGFSAGSGLMIDMSGFNDVVIDETQMRVTVGAGCTFRKFNATLAPYDLHVPGGECEGVCIGGYVQGGGIGFTSATFGMNCDNVVAMRVMLHDGSIVIASETQNKDLWWAMRGGTGGNFGVLLNVIYNMHKLESCTGWALAWSMNTAEERAVCADVMKLLDEEYIIDSPLGEKLTLQVLWVWQNILDPKGPRHDPMIPVFMVRGLWIGDRDGAVQSMKPLQQLPGCITQFVKTGAYPDVLKELLSNPQEQPYIAPSQGMPFEDKSSRYIADPIDKQDWISILDYFVEESPNDLTYGYLEVYTGAINSYPLANSAFIHRNVMYDAVMDVFWFTEDERAGAERFMHTWNKMMEQRWNGHIYQNYVSMAVPEYYTNYWGEAAPLLYSIKLKYDPETHFRFAQQVPRPLLYEEGGDPVAPGYEEIVEVWKLPVDYTHGSRAK